MTDFNPSMYITCPALQQSFINKDTGDLLAGGYIYFYADNSRNTLQDVFYLTGSPPNYQVTPLPNPLILSSIGTIVDPNGNPCLVYLYPYDLGGNSSSYYVEVYSGDPNVDGVLQFTLENVGDAGNGPTPPSVAGNNNYVVNGQFFLHNNIPNDADNNGEGYISSAETVIAPGGHFFLTDASFNPSQSKQLVNFLVIPDTEETGAPVAFPRYWAQFQQVGTNFTGTYKQYSFRFRNVNLFTQTQITLGFAAQAPDDVTTVSVFYRLFFGTGGSATVTSTFGSQNVEQAPGSFSFSTTIPAQTGATLGTQGDDYVEIGINFPNNSPYNVYVTDVIIAEGNEQGTLTYPVTSPQQMYANALGGGYSFNAIDQSTGQYVYDGSQIYLPVIINKYGFAPDYSVIGTVEAFSALPDWSNIPCLFADGSSYQVNLTSPLGIPYSRLATFYQNQNLTFGGFVYGTGYEFFTLNIVSNGVLLFNNNNASVAPVSQSGAIFDLTVTSQSTANGYYVKTWIVPTVSTDVFYIQNKNVGSVTSAAAGTSTFTVNTIISTTGTAGTLVSDGSRELTSVQTVAASALSQPGAPGLYFTFSSYNGSEQKYYVWFKISNETDPAPAGYMPIMIQLDSTDDAYDVAIKIQSALIGGEVTNISNIPAASSITPGYYFTAQSSNLNTYDFWFSVDGAGTAPTNGNINVEIQLEGSYSSNQVMDAISAGVNTFCFGVPDYRGMFLRGWNDGSWIDADAAYRYSLETTNASQSGDKVGTYQYDMLMQHSHMQQGNTSAQQQNAADRDCVQQGEAYVSPSGGSETRPYNVAVAYGIRY